MLIVLGITGLLIDPLGYEGKVFLVPLLSIKPLVHLSSFLVTKRFLQIKKRFQKLVLVFMDKALLKNKVCLYQKNMDKVLHNFSISTANGIGPSISVCTKSVFNSMSIEFV